MIRAVLFDIGGPLDLEYLNESLIDEDIIEGFNQAGIRIEPAVYELAVDAAVDSFAPNTYRSIVWRLAEYDEALAHRVHEYLRLKAIERDLFELRPGMPEVLESLAGAGLALGLAANQPQAVLERLKRNGIGHFFSGYALGGVHGLRKPDVRLFLKACEDLQVEPSECVMVGDRIDNDISPARSLGMATVLIRTGRHRKQRARSWDEVPDREVTDSDGILRAVLDLVASSR